MDLWGDIKKGVENFGQDLEGDIRDAFKGRVSDALNLNDAKKEVSPAQAPAPAPSAAVVAGFDLRKYIPILAVAGVAYLIFRKK